MPTTRPTKLDRAVEMKRAHRKWMEERGGCLEGYFEFYPTLPRKQVTGIFEADAAALAKAEKRVEELSHK